VLEECLILNLQPAVAHTVFSKPCAPPALLRKKGLKRTASIVASFSVALALVIVYSILIDARRAMAAPVQLDVYYYTSDHIGRPFNLRDESKTLTWYEQHYPFGEVIVEEVAGGTILGGSTMYAGAGSYAIIWKPNFRFPGQYEDSDMGTAANSRPLFVQNHYREYMPRFGRYNRVDPIENNYYSGVTMPIVSYIYAHSNSIKNIDASGLQTGFEPLFMWHPLYRCAAAVFNSIGNIDWNDTKQHCVATCIIQCVCPLASDPMVLSGGLLREFSGGFEFRDILNNSEGMKCANIGITKLESSLRNIKDENCCKVNKCDCIKCCDCSMQF
jgi:RHS repeat-associated protein